MILILSLSQSVAGQAPYWGSYIALENSQAIVIAKMHIEDLNDGHGVLTVSKVLKGDENLQDIKVQFSNRHPSKYGTKQAEPPKYWYTEGQEGIWLLTSKNQFQRYNLMAKNVFFDKKWRAWLLEKLIAMERREWTRHNGLSGSVIVDDAGPNKLYRFFYLSLRNDSNTPLYINTHYRIREDLHRRFEASIITPGKKRIKMVNGNHPDCRLAGEPGWAVPDIQDFVKLEPGETINLFTSGDLQSFFGTPIRGEHSFHASYYNDYESQEIEGEIWKGRIEFPVTRFRY